MTGFSRRRPGRSPTPIPADIEAWALGKASEYMAGPGRAADLDAQGRTFELARSFAAARELGRADGRVVLAGVTGLEETVRLEFERVLGRAKAAGDVGGIFSGFEGGAGNPGREGVVVAVQPSYVGALIRMVMDERRRQEGGRR